MSNFTLLDTQNTVFAHTLEWAPTPRFLSYVPGEEPAIDESVDDKATWEPLLPKLILSLQPAMDDRHAQLSTLHYLTGPSKHRQRYSSGSLA